MNRSYAYALAGAVLAGVAVLVVRSYSDGPPSDPLDEVDRMMAQTRQKMIEIQRNFNEFRQVLTQAASLDSVSQPSPPG